MLLEPMVGRGHPVGRIRSAHCVPGPALPASGFSESPPESLMRRSMILLAAWLTCAQP
ncbi:MAG: hypothetical protein RIS35_2408, partial [Pseudomonadota bacterium]